VAFQVLDLLVHGLEIPGRGHLAPVHPPFQLRPAGARHLDLLLQGGLTDTELVAPGLDLGGAALEGGQAALRPRPAPPARAGTTSAVLAAGRWRCRGPGPRADGRRRPRGPDPSAGRFVPLPASVTVPHLHRSPSGSWPEPSPARCVMAAGGGEHLRLRRATSSAPTRASSATARASSHSYHRASGLSPGGRRRVVVGGQEEVPQVEMGVALGRLVDIEVDEAGAPSG
jgi:hypothetical protein